MYTGILYTRKTGKVVKTLESGSKGMLLMWSMKNVSPSRNFVILDDNGREVEHLEGRKNLPPKRLTVGQE